MPGVEELKEFISECLTEKEYLYLIKQIESFDDKYKGTRWRYDNHYRHKNNLTDRFFEVIFYEIGHENFKYPSPDIKRLFRELNEYYQYLRAKK